MPLTIAIDGPVGAGKSTVSDEVARRLGKMPVAVSGRVLRWCRAVVAWVVDDRHFVGIALYTATHICTHRK